MTVVCANLLRKPLGSAHALDSARDKDVRLPPKRTREAILSLSRDLAIFRPETDLAHTVADTLSDRGLPATPRQVVLTLAIGLESFERAYAALKSAVEGGLTESRQLRVATWEQREVA